MYIYMFRKWEWAETSGKRWAIHMFGGNLLWYMDITPGAAGESTRWQAFREFMTSGSLIALPEQINKEVREHLSTALLYGYWSMDDSETL